MFATLVALGACPEPAVLVAGDTLESALCPPGSAGAAFPGQGEGFPMAVPPGHAILPRSKVDRKSRFSTLLTLVRIDPSSCKTPPIDVAWSYDG